VPHILLGAYAVLFAVCAIGPYDRATWWAENIPILLIVGTLVVVGRWHRFSDTAYLLMSVLVYMHTIGGHFTFERVPFGWVTDLFGFQRNHYDRVAHFSVGFFAYAIAELLDRRRLVRSPVVLYLFPLFTILSIAAGYELVEWVYAVAEGGESGQAVLGSQGDVWDAQKDMLADGLGALCALAFYAARHGRGMASRLGGGG